MGKDESGKSGGSEGERNREGLREGRGKWKRTGGKGKDECASSFSS